MNLLPPLHARLAVLAAAGHRLLAIVCASTETTVANPTVGRDAEAAFLRAAMVCPAGAPALLDGFTDAEREFLRSVLAFPSVWSLSLDERLAAVEPLNHHRRRGTGSRYHRLASSC